jgi:hypothetical protein
MPVLAARPRFVDTVIVGTGPSALILSYILNGYHPYLCADTPHPDAQLQAKLARLPSLLEADFRHLTAHFPASRFSYSTQALPVNTLLDTLIRPLGDTAPGLHPPCILWRNTQQTVDHLVLGLDHAAGGQWQESMVASSADISALSYADLLSLPGYTMAQHLENHGINDDKGFLRPTRRHVAEYLAIWPSKVGIESSLWLGRAVQDIKRCENNEFYVTSHQLRCRRIVLATGTFTELVPPGGLLPPLLQLKPSMPVSSDVPPLLVIGSGFSAADVILTALPQHRHILHIFKWDPSNIASPLRACHPSAYPEYASVFKRMKRAANEASSSQVDTPELRREMQKRRKSSTYALERPEWDGLYEGLPNARISAVKIHAKSDIATVTLERAGGGSIEREVSGLQYVIGRRGSLAYLDREIRAEVLGADVPQKVIDVGGPIQARMLRAKVERSETFEMTRGVYLIGSLLGDSLIRHAYGGCVVVARELLAHQKPDHRRGTIITEAQATHSAVMKEYNALRPASEEVAEAVALALSGGKPLPALPIKALHPRPTTTVSAENTEQLEAYDPYPISLEFSEPPLLKWRAHERYVGADSFASLNDHEHLGDAKHAILGSRSAAWCECSNGESGVPNGHHISGEEVAAY